MDGSPTDGAAHATAAGGPGADPGARSGGGARLPSPVTWTGGQHALVRIAAGLLAIGAVADWAGHAAALPAAGETGTMALTVAGVLLAVLLARGRRERLAAALLAAVAAGWVALLGRAPVPGEVALVLALVLLAWQPASPVLGVDARTRVDPSGWRHRRAAWLSAWIGLAALSLWSAGARLASALPHGGDLGETGALAALGGRLRDVLAHDGTDLGRALAGAPEGVLAALAGAALLADLLFVPLALARRTRALGWTLLLLRQAGTALLVEPAAGGLGPVLLLLLAFDPAWVPRRDPAGLATVFYDGHCGLCHATVRLLLAEDTGGELFRFAPLQGRTFERTVPADVRARLPDSLVLRTPRGDLLLRSDAAGHALLCLGGLWRVLGATLLRLPRPLRDGAYDAVARVRKRLFGAPEDTCPLLPPHLRERMLD